MEVQAPSWHHLHEIVEQSVPLTQVPLVQVWMMVPLHRDDPLAQSPIHDPLEQISPVAEQSVVFCQAPLVQISTSLPLHCVVPLFVQVVISKHWATPALTWQISLKAEQSVVFCQMPFVQVWTSLPLHCVSPTMQVSNSQAPSKQNVPKAEQSVVFCQAPFVHVWTSLPLHCVDPLVQLAQAHSDLHFPPLQPPTRPSPERAEATAIIWKKADAFISYVLRS